MTEIEMDDVPATDNNAHTDSQDINKNQQINRFHLGLYVTGN
jgi:hypothetical protein